VTLALPLALEAGLAVLVVSLVAQAHHAAVGAQAADGAPAVLGGASSSSTAAAAVACPLLAPRLRVTPQGCGRWGGETHDA